jgi:hypothetical protein
MPPRARTGGCSGGPGSTPCIDPSAVNGHNGITCNGGLSLAGGPTLNFGTGNFAIAYVLLGTGALWNEGGGALALGTDSANNYSLGINAIGRVVIPEMNTNVWHALIARGAAMDLLTDWGQSATGPTNTTTGITTAGGGGLPLCGGGEMAEIIAINGTLSDADRASLMGYFKAKFKL